MQEKLNYFRRARNLFNGGQIAYIRNSTSNEWKAKLPKKNLKYCPTGAQLFGRRLKKPLA
jgi:hypothetical protein